MTQLLPLSPPLSVPSPRSPHAELALTLLGPSAAMAQLWTQIRRLAPYVRTVLLTGEPECGQEAVARLLLDLSPQNSRTFLQMSAQEAEARLLRPSGLVSFPPDVFLFLPDVHLLSLAAQEALVRLIRMRRSRLFSLIAASSEDLRPLVAAGQFSAELSSLLTSVRLAVPSVRQRAEDVPMLVSQLVQLKARALQQTTPHTSEEFLRAAMQYSWPGNLRELARVIQILCAEKDRQSLSAADLANALAQRQPAPTTAPSPARLIPLDQVMQEHILAVLRACRGNKVRAAEVLGISRSTLYRMLDTGPTASYSSLPLAS